MEDPRIKEIRAAEDRIRFLVDTAENKRREAIWSDKNEARDYNWHPLPRNTSRMPYSFEIERIGYAQMMGFDLVKFYSDPVEFLLQSLKMSIFKFETFPEDCTPISKIVTYWPGVGYDASLFGLEQIITGHDAWVGKDPLFKDMIPLENISYPDFYTSPEMVKTHAFYKKMVEIVSPDFTVNFPQFCRSPWSVAWALRGIDNLIYDYCDDPDWVKGLVDLITEYRIRWSKQRAEFLGIPLSTTNFYNDEVMSPMVSPSMYRDIILPSEKRISEAFGGINYWHSCGNTTPFMEMINTIPNVAMVHVSPWSDVWHAVEVYSHDKVIECALNPMDDVMLPLHDHMVTERIIEVKEATKDYYSVCRADGFEVIHDVKTDIKILNNWIDTANKILLS